jgi:putative ABC transport system permease protein
MAAPLLSLRFSIRQLRKSPGFALTASLTLALGIGAAVSVFSVVDTVLLKPFAFGDPGRLVVMREVVDEMRSQYPAVPFNYRHYLRLRKDSRTLQDAAIFQQHGASVSPSGDHPHIVGAMAVSQNFLPVLGVEPAMGRNFLPEELTEGHSSVVILTWNGWKTLFDGNPNVLGQTVRISGVRNTVIGVLPASFAFPEVAMDPNTPSSVSQPGAVRTYEIFHPLVADKNDLVDDNYDYNFSVIGRLKPGVSVAQARAEMGGLQEAYSRSAHLLVHNNIYIEPFANDVTAGVSTGLWLIFAAVGGVLLIACVNLANLQLARAVAMERESAVRAALGASRGELLLSRLTESFVLAFVGGVAGVALAFLGVRLLVAFAPADVPRLSEIQVSLPVLVFAAGLSVFAALLFGILPALRSLRVDPQSALQANPSRVVNTRSSSRTRSLLVAGEVACTVVLLMVTGLVLRSFSQVMRQTRGFDTDHVTAAQVDLYAPQYAYLQPHADTARAAFIDRTLAALGQLPGVTSAAMVSAMPLTGETWIDLLTRPDHPVPAGHEPEVNVRFVSPSYFAAMRIPVLSGRGFTEADRVSWSSRGDKSPAAPMPILISEKAAREAFPGENPVGHQTRAFGDDARSGVVVGVVADARINGLRNTAAMGYVPYWENPQSTATFLVRSTQPSSVVIPEMRKAIWQADPQVAIPALKSLDEQVRDSVSGDRFQTLLLSSFGAAALLLALLGVYGVLAYSVSLRQQEFGIRIALGSDKGRLMLLVLRQAAWPVLAGAGAGLVLAFVATRWVRSLLYETHAADPLAIGGTLVLLAVVAALAAILPARRASRVDPIEVLRAQ